MIEGSQKHAIGKAPERLRLVKPEKLRIHRLNDCYHHIGWNSMWVKFREVKNKLL